MKIENEERSANMNTIEKMKTTYTEALLDGFVPYWIDMFDDDGAILNCIAEDKTILSYDRYIWSQGRALWTFSAIYNRIKKDEKFLRRADGLFSYLSKIGPGQDGKWNYLYDKDGNMLENDISIYVDGFVLAGLTEYYIATKSEKAKEMAIAIYENTKKRLETPGSYFVAPYVIPEGMKTHGVNMIFSFFYYNLGKAIDRQDICDYGVMLADEVIDKFYSTEREVLCEFIHIDGKYRDTSMERACVPGHVIECMWFLISIYEELNDDEKIKKCCHIIKQHIDYGWDKEKGGMILAFDIKGIKPCFWQKESYKPWWVQIEALVSTAYAYKHTKDAYFMEMHKKIFDFAFAHYPNGYGDWINWLDNDGNVADSAALPVKDPFHLPRGLIYLSKLFEDETILNYNYN